MCDEADAVPAMKLHATRHAVPVKIGVRNRRLAELTTAGNVRRYLWPWLVLRSAKSKSDPSFLVLDAPSSTKPVARPSTAGGDAAGTGKTRDGAGQAGKTGKAGKAGKDDVDSAGAEDAARACRQFTALPAGAPPALGCALYRSTTPVIAQLRDALPFSAPLCVGRCPDVSAWRLAPLVCDWKALHVRLAPPKAADLGRVVDETWSRAVAGGEDFASDAVPDDTASEAGDSTDDGEDVDVQTGSDEFDDSDCSEEAFESEGGEDLGDTVGEEEEEEEEDGEVADSETDDEDDSGVDTEGEDDGGL